MSGKNLKGLSFLKTIALLGLVVPGMCMTPAWGQNVFWRKHPLLPGERYRPNDDLLRKRSPSAQPLLIIDQRGIQQQLKEEARLNTCGPDAAVTGFETYPDGTMRWVNLECEALKDGQKGKGK